MNEITKGRCIAAHVPNWVHAGCESGKAFETASLNNDLIYAGNDYNLDGRKALLESLVGSSSGLNFALYQALGNPRIHGQAYYDQLSSSLMGLSLSRRFDVPWYTSDRMQQEMGNGVCTISPSTEGLTQLFSTDEVVWFDHEDEILEKVNWYKSHESDARAIGWRELDSCTSKMQRFRSLVEEVLCHACLGLSCRTYVSFVLGILSVRGDACFCARPIWRCIRFIASVTSGSLTGFDFWLDRIVTIVS